MKNIFFTLFAAILLFACAPVDSYKISGTYDGAPENGRVYLAQLTDTSIDYIDSVDIKNGRFELVGKQDTPIVRFLFYPMPDGGEDILPMVLENGGIYVKIGRNGARVSGTGLNDAMQAYKDEFDDVSRRAEKFFYAGL